MSLTDNFIENSAALEAWINENRVIKAIRNWWTDCKLTYIHSKELGYWEASLFVAELRAKQDETNTLLKEGN